MFDLGRGGDFRLRPDASFGEQAYDDAAARRCRSASAGAVGAGTGAVAGGLKGGVGSASAVLADGTTVAALAVVNAVGSAVDPRTGELLGARHGLPGDGSTWLRGAGPEPDLAAAPRCARPPQPVRRWPRRSACSPPT